MSYLKLLKKRRCLQYSGAWLIAAMFLMAGVFTSSTAQAVDTLTATQTSSVYAAGSNLTVTMQINYSVTGTLSALGVDVTLPSGWTYVSNGGTNTPQLAAQDGTILSLAWFSFPASPVNFTYTVSVPAGTTGTKSIAANIKYRIGSGSEQQVSATPNPLQIQSDAPSSYTVAVSASPSAGGTASGGGTFTAGSRTVTATANSGYTFANWTESGTVVSSSASYNFTLSGNLTLVANFTANPVNYTVAVSASPSAGGTASGGGTFVAGSSVTVTATANSGYTFANWTESGTVVSSSASYNFTLSGNRTLVANFTANPVYYTLAVSASPSAGGTASGGGTFVAGSSVTVTATANSGYAFANWTESGTVVSSSASYSFTLSGPRTLVANFTANPVNYTVAVSASPSAGGTASGGGTFTSGSSVTVTATANSGYTFANWTESGTVVSSSASYSFTLSGPRTLVANFTANPVNYTVAVSASPSAGGTVSGGGTFAAGSRTVTATANSGYAFSNWTENGTVVSSSASYSFTLSGNRTLVANFANTPPNQFNFTDQTGVALSTVVTSNIITVTGINAAVAISIAGGQYSINGGAYTSTAGTVNNGDTVTVRLTSSGSYSTSVNAILTIGELTDTFVVTTGKASVTSSNAVISDVTVTDSIANPPANYTPQAVVSFKASGVVSTANFSISYASLPANSVFYKVVSGEWKKIYPTNQATGITNIVLSGTTLSFTIADNSASDGDPTVGVISDPLVVGSEAPPAPVSSGGGGGGGCFIATAAWGSYLDPHVLVLRDFRDRYLITNRPGKAFVDYYYSVSPPIAGYIQQHEALRTITRFMLTPIVFGLEYPWLVLIFGGFVIGMWSYRKRGSLKSSCRAIA